MNKIIYGFILFFSITAFSQDFKYCFSSRYAVSSDGKSGYIRGELENIEGLFFFDMKFAYFELKGTPAEPLDFDGVKFQEEHPDIYEMEMTYSFHRPSGNFDIKVYQFLDRRIQIFSSYGGKKYLYIIDKVIDENGTVYSVKT